MAYIGNKPANKAIVASDLDPAVITGQTALAVAPASTDEFLISDAGVLKRLDASFIGGANTPCFQATMSGNQNISNSTATKVQFDTETFDTDGKYDHSTNYRFTPTVAGKYHVTVKVSYEDASADDKTQSVMIYKNGSMVHEHRTRTVSSTGRDKSTEVNAIVDLDADDYVEAYTFQSVGSTIAVLTGTNSARSVFQAFKIIT